MVKKYIITAKNHKDILALSLNTRSVDLAKVKWDWTHMTKSEDDANCTDEQEILDALSNGSNHLVDSMIMGGDVPVGGMVVVCDGGKKPRKGFVCGNGTDWFVKNLKIRESNAIAYSILKDRGQKPKADSF